MRGERRIDLDLTIHVHQRHVTCKLDPYKWISPAKKSTSKIVVQKGPPVSQMLTIADKGGGVLKKYQQRVVIGKKNAGREENWFRFNHTCSSKPCNMQIGPIQINIPSKKVHVENCSTKGASGKCWQKLTKGGGGVSQMLTIADGGGSRNPWFWLT